MYTGKGSAPKLERKYVEKNRRNHLKTLFNQLYSLLPPHAFQEAMALPDQVDAAVTYIKSLEIKLEKNKMQLEKLRTSKKRPNLCMAIHDPNPTTKLSPQIEVHEMSPTMDVILMTGLDNLTMFYNIIRLLHEEGFKVVNANFSLEGNSTMQILHENKIIENSTMESRATTVCSRLKELLYGSSSPTDDDIIETLLRLWDYDIQSEMLKLI
ncbi:transcription factor bHLH162-like isoform X2 [Lycium ferocissimum]|uniref:transcription factor bHLH162-like isoform X2 n=1 Tax=Lycium ferocissimum TaxID=112874 RepID=UPI002816124F|nr:transcription factor bHLH162-like isoform X2 [Lycium ferocissimum]